MNQRSKTGSFWKTIMIVYLSSFPRAGNTHKFSFSVVTFLRAGNRKQWTNSLSKQGVWRIRPAFALHLNQDSHEAILSSKSRGRWARQCPRRRVRGCDGGGGRELGRDHGRGEQEKHWQYPAQGDIPPSTSSAPPPPPPESPPTLIINFVIIIAWLQFQFIWRRIIRNKLTA